MTEDDFTGPSNLDKDSTQPKPALRVVIAYGDLMAGKRAIRVVSNLVKNLDPDTEFQPLPWSFELLADPDWREIALRDTASADILMIATSDTQPFPPDVQSWMTDAIGRKQGTAAAVIALLGPAENPDCSRSARLERIWAAAQGAGLDFFAPLARRPQPEPSIPLGGSPDTSSRIHSQN